MVLPSALKLQPFQKTGTMKIQTSVLEPQIAANNFVRYVLEKRAILHSDSIFTFSLTPTATLTEANYATLPVNTGIGCLIKNCTLRLGNVVVSRTQDWAHYDTMSKCFTGAEERTLKDSVIRGVSDTWRPSTLTDGQFSRQSSDYVTAVDAIPAHQHNLFNTPIFSIKLSELFPALQGMQIPLGHMEDNMVVEFELNTQGAGQAGVLAVFQDNPAPADCVMTPNYTEMTMLADYLSFSDATFEEIDDEVNGGNGLVMPFHEIITIQGHVPAVDNPPDDATVVDQSVTQELGLAGRTVKSIVVADCPEGLRDPELDEMTGRRAGVYYNQSFQKAPETQVKVNDLNVFPRPIDSVTTHITEVEKAMNRQLGICRAEYDLGVSFWQTALGTVGQNVIDAGVTTTGTVVAGARHMEGVSLLTDPIAMKGTPIIDKPIRYERVLKRTHDNEIALTSRYYCAVEKAFAIKDGQVAVMA